MGKLDSLAQGISSLRDQSPGDVGDSIYNEMESLSGRRDIPLDRLIVDEHIQIRARGLNQEYVDSLAVSMEAGEKIPPVVVFAAGDGFLLADGFHRVAAAEQIGAESIRAVVRSGGYNDAMRYAAGANLQHGLALSKEDKLNVLRIMLESGEWAQLSDGVIAGKLGVARTTIINWRRQLASPVNFDMSPTQRIGADGRTYSVENIGKAAQERRHEPEPLPERRPMTREEANIPERIDPFAHTRRDQPVPVDRDTLAARTELQTALLQACDALRRLVYMEDIGFMAGHGRGELVKALADVDDLIDYLLNAESYLNLLADMRIALAGMIDEVEGR